MCFLTWSYDTGPALSSLGEFTQPVQISEVSDGPRSPDVEKCWKMDGYIIEVGVISTHL